MTSECYYHPISIISLHWSTQTIPNVSVSNQFSVLGQQQPTMSQAPRNNASANQWGSHSLSTSEQTLSQMGTTDSSTALIIGEMQNMRSGLFHDLTSHFNQEMGKMRRELAESYDQRELGQVSVTGSLEGETLEEVVASVVEKTLT